MANTIATRFLLLSDTHGDNIELPSAHRYDVAIHCGDLTQESKLEEFKASLELLAAINAPLKLVIGGNHDFTLDVPMLEKKLAEAQLSPEDESVRKEFGGLGQARALFEAEDVKAKGIVFLDEGTHHFHLGNGAVLTVYASPYTPSRSDWGFQYDPSIGRSFDIGAHVDVVVTHGPPKGVLDYTDARQRAGCPDLFSAVSRARPQMHCFGHIHEGWGAKRVRWREELVEEPTHFTAFDNERSVVFETLAGLQPSRFDSEVRKEEKAVKAVRYKGQGSCLADGNVEVGAETLFVNAAVQGSEKNPVQLPWVVELQLPRGGLV